MILSVDVKKPTLPCKDYVLTGLETSYSLITKLALYTSRVYENKHHAFTFNDFCPCLRRASVSVSIVFPVLISLTTIYTSPRVEVYYSLHPLESNMHLCSTRPSSSRSMHSYRTGAELNKDPGVPRLPDLKSEAT